MTASTNPPYAVPLPVATTTDGVPEDWDDPLAVPDGGASFTDPLAEPPALTAAVDGSPMVGDDPLPDPQNPLVTKLDTVLVPWLSPEPAPGGPSA